MDVDLGIWSKLTKVVVALLITAFVLLIGMCYLPLIRQNERMRADILRLHTQLQKEEETSKQLRAEIDFLRNNPPIAEQVRQLVINRAGVPSEKVCVYTLNQAEQEELVEAGIVAQGANGPVIENPELADVKGAQAIAGQQRVDSLLKELSKEPMSRAYEIAGTDTKIGTDKQSSYGKTTNDLPVGTTAPVGTKQNIVYRKPKGNK